MTVWSPMMVTPTDLGDQRWILEAALDHVRKIAPDLPVTSAVTSGPASVALENASADADTLVVGARGRGVVEEHPARLDVSPRRRPRSMPRGRGS